MTVPIIGQPANLLMWWPSAILRCNCTAATEPTRMCLVVLTGVGNAVKCGNCDHLYIIRGVQPDGSLHVDMATPTPTKDVM